MTLVVPISAESAAIPAVPIAAAPRRFGPRSCAPDRLLRFGALHKGSGNLVTEATAEVASYDPR